MTSVREAASNLVLMTIGDRKQERSFVAGTLRINSFNSCLRLAARKVLGSVLVRDQECQRRCYFLVCFLAIILPILHSLSAGNCIGYSGLEQATTHLLYGTLDWQTHLAAPYPVLPLSFKFMPSFAWYFPRSCLKTVASSLAWVSKL